MTMLSDQKDYDILTILTEAEEWYDDNDIAECETDPPGEAMYDGFEMLIRMIKIKKGIK